MKYFSLLLLAVISFCNLLAQPRKSDRSFANLKDHVKSFTETSYEATEKFGDLVQGKKQWKRTETYNIAGFTTEYFFENYEKNIKMSREYSYDGNNNVTERKETYNGKATTTKMTFNAQGKIEEENSYDNKDKLTGKTKYKYNAAGHNHLWNEYNGDGKLVYTMETTFNAKGEPVSFTGRNGARELKFSANYEYDEWGNLVEENISFSNDKNELTETKNVYDFNSRDQKTEKVTTGKNPLEISYDYDIHGNLVTETKLLEAGILETTYAYTYDNQSNWTKLVRTITNEEFDLKTSSIMEREIRYYDEKDIPVHLRIKKFAIPTTPGQSKVMTGARSWEVVSALLGSSLPEVRAILKQVGFADSDRELDKESGIHIYYFYPHETENEDNEPDYMIGFEKGKAVFLSLDFEYETSPKGGRDSDVNTMKKAVLSLGFVFSEQHQNKYATNYLYHSAKGQRAVIAVSKAYQSIWLALGDQKYINRPKD